MQQNYDIFYKLHGVRRLQSLLSPILFNFISFPKNSLLHYISFSDELDIDTSKLYFSGFTKKILVDYMDTLIETKGNPTHKTLNIRSETSSFHNKNKDFKYFKDHYISVKDEMTLLINNYSYLHRYYKYIETNMSEFYKWSNIQKTMYAKINEIANISNRNNFIIINVPMELPSVNLLKLYSDKTNTTMLKIFNSYDKLMLLELWKWMNPATRNLSVLNAIKIENLNKLTMVFINSDNMSVMINLGYLNSWIKGFEAKTDQTNINKIDAFQMQKLFLRLFISVNSKVMEKEPTEIEVKKENNDSDIDKVEESEILDESQEYENEHSEDSEDEQTDETIFSDPKIGAVNNNPLPAVTDVDSNIFGQDKDLNSYFQDVDNDLKSLEKINNKQLKDKGIHITDSGEEVEIDLIDTRSIEEIKAAVYSNVDVVTDLKNQISEGADYNLITASDFKKLSADIDKFVTMPNPYNVKENLIKASEISSSDISINEESTKIIASKIVQDEDMLTSSLNSFDSDYIENVLQKDILSMVSSIQKTGVIIKRYEIEDDSSAMGDYEHHTLELKPLDGAASTIHFRIPKINKDGTFIANGNKYSMRKQRADKKFPILW